MNEKEQDVLDVKKSYKHNISLKGTRAVLVLTGTQPKRVHRKLPLSEGDILDALDVKKAQ